MCELNFFYKLSAVLVLLGAINCGAIGLFTTNVIASLVGNNVIIFRVIYILILMLILSKKYHHVLKNT